MFLNHVLFVCFPLLCLSRTGHFFPGVCVKSGGLYPRGFEPVLQWTFLWQENHCICILHLGTQFSRTTVSSSCHASEMYVHVGTSDCGVLLFCESSWVSENLLAVFSWSSKLVDWNIALKFSVGFGKWKNHWSQANKDAVEFMEIFFCFSDNIKWEWESWKWAKNSDFATSTNNIWYSGKGNGQPNLWWEAGGWLLSIPITDEIST